METFWQRLRRRKMVEWAVGYLAAGFALLQVADVLEGAFAWPSAALRVITVVVAFGFIAVLVIAWYHGERGHQRAPKGEVALLASTFILAVAVSWYVGVTGPGASSSSGAAGGGTELQTMGEDPRLALFDPTTADNSVAVLPFVNLTPDSNNDYLTEGITEDIITQLGQIEGLRVISRTSVMRYRDTEKSIREIGAELQVKTILEGSVRVQGDRVRIVAQLIDVATDGHLWADTYDRDLKDILAVQAEVAQSIAKALNAELMPGAAVVAAEETQADPEAYRLYSKGLQLANEATPDSRAKAIEMLDSAIERDPNFGPAWAALADLQVPLTLDAPPPPAPPQVGPVQGVAPASGVDRVLDVATKAVEMNPNHADARSALAFLRAFRGRDFEAAERAAREAVRANPNSVQARLRYAQILFSRGWHESARRELRAAAALDPHSPIVHAQLGEMALATGDLEDAERHLRRAIALDSSLAQPHVTLGLVYHKQGRHDDALAQMRAASALAPNEPHVLGPLGFVLGTTGHPEEARAIVSRLVEQTDSGRALHGAIAQIYLGVGEMQQAADWIRKAAEQERGPMPTPRVQTVYRLMLDDPRMKHMLDSMGINVEFTMFPDSADRRRTRESGSRTGGRR